MNKNRFTILIIYYIGNWLKLKVDGYDKEKYMLLSTLLKKLPVAVFNKQIKTYYISLYYLNEFTALLDKEGLKYKFVGNVKKRYLNLIRWINKKKFNKCFTLQKPKLWTDDKDKQLYNYQKLAVELHLRRSKFINAFEMGLGKTIVALASMCYAFEIGYKRTLIVCSSSIIEQWKDEILKFTKIEESKIAILSGSIKKESFLCEKNKYFNIKECKSCIKYLRCRSIYDTPDKYRKYILTKQKENKQIVISSYALLYKYKDYIIKGDFDIIIVDEVSKVKNYSTRQTKGLMKICENLSQDDLFIPMSGTLIENTIAEFYPVYNMIDDAIFGIWSNFKNRYLMFDYFGALIGIKNEKELQNITSKFFIRKTLDEVWKERPEIILITKFCEMSNVHKTGYNEIVEGTISDVKKEYNGKIDKIQLSALISYLLMVADSLEVVKELGKYSADEYSCKLKFLKYLLKEEIDDKVVLFSKYAKKILPILSRELENEKIKHLIITGATKTKDRNVLIKKFTNEDYKIILCSDAMGYGVNMQCAKYVINFDLPWNPAVLSQRIARVYRRGQKKNVNVINLITKDTVENIILDKLEIKQEMFDKFIGAGIKPKSVVGQLSVDDILKKVK